MDIFYSFNSKNTINYKSKPNTLTNMETKSNNTNPSINIMNFQNKSEISSLVIKYL
jgi:hypothetical protein